MMNKKLRQPKAAGFTIVELMIATTVFSVVLLLCTYGLVRIGQSYYRGVTSSRVQTAARSITDNLTQAVQYGGQVTIYGLGGADGTVCIGRGRYHYTAPQGLGFDNSSLKYDEPVNCVDGTSSTAKELLPAGLRLSKLGLTRSSATEPYEITVKVTSGDKDLFSNGENPVTGFCKGGAGFQFCAVSNIVTTASPRL